MSRKKVEYQSLLDSIENPVVAVQEDMEIIYCNAAYAQLFGRWVDELEGQKLLELFPENIGTVTHLAYLEVLETGRGKAVERKIGNEYISERIYRTPEGLISIADNISDTKRWEEAVQAFTADYRAVFDETDDAVVILEVDDNRIVDVNKAACDMFAYSREEMLGLHAGDLSAEETPYNRDDFVRWVKKPSELKSQRMEWRSRDRSGRMFWIEVKTKRIKIGDELRVLAVIQDITRSKYLEKEIRDINDSYQGLFQSPGDLIFTHDLGGNFISVNQASERITGYWAEELIKMNIQQLVVSDCLKLMRSFQYQRMPQNQASNYELEIETKYKNRVFLDVKIWPIYRGGKPAVIQGIAWDITDRKRKELELQESADSLANFIDYLPDATMAIDMEGRVVVWNQGMEELTGIKAEDMLGKGDYEYALGFYNKRRPIMVDLVLWPEEVEQYYSIIEVDKYTVICEMETPYLKGGGHYLWGQAMPWYNQKGELIGAIESLRDITDRYKSRQELKEARGQLKQDRRCLFNLIDNLDGPVVSYDVKGEIMLANRKFSQAVGYPVKNLAGMNIADIIEEPGGVVFGNAMIKPCQEDRRMEYEVILRNKEGFKEPVRVTINPMWEKEAIVGCILRIEDKLI